MLIVGLLPSRATTCPPSLSRRPATTWAQPAPLVPQPLRTRQLVRTLSLRINQPKRRDPVPCRSQNPVSLGPRMPFQLSGSQNSLPNL